MNCRISGIMKGIIIEDNGRDKQIHFKRGRENWEAYGLITDEELRKY